MLVSRPSSLDLLALLQCQEYLQSPEFIARRTLLDQMIDPEAYRDLFVPGVGRPSWPVSVMLRAIYLQKEEGWSDRRLVGELHDNQRVRLLVGLPAYGKSPKRSAIMDFRRRLLETGQHTLAFRQQQLFLAQTGLIDQADPLTIDSTPYLTAAAQPTVVGLLQHAMRRFWLALRNWDAALAAQIRDRLHLEAWCQPRFQRCSAGLHSRQGRRLWQRYFQKSTALLKAVPITDNRAVEDARSLLVRVRAERGPQGTDTPPDRITNAMDGRARFGCKGKGSSKRTWHGYKATLITHAATDLILSVDVMPAQHVDGDALVPAVDALAPAFSHPRTLDGDEAYTSQGNRREMRKVGVCLIGPRTTKRRRGQVPGGGRVAKRVDRARRSRIEHVVAHVVRWRHNRRSPYIGLRKAWLQAAFAVCAANLVRLLTLWREHRLELPGLQPAA